MIQRFRQFAADENAMAMTEFVATLPVIIIIFVGIVKLHEQIIETFSDMGSQYAGTWERATAMDARRSGESRPSAGTSAEPYRMPGGSVADAFDRESIRTGAGVVGGEVYRETHYQVYAHPNEVDFNTSANQIQNETIEEFQRPLRFETRSYTSMSDPEAYGYASLAAFQMWLAEDRMACFEAEFDSCTSAALDISHVCHDDPSGCCEERAGSACKDPDEWGTRVQEAGWRAPTAYFRGDHYFVSTSARQGEYLIGCYQTMGNSMGTAADYAEFEACLAGRACAGGGCY